MQKQEFEERIERTVTDEQYKVIEEVYMWHPSIRNTSGKDEVASPITWVIVGIVALVAAFVVLWNKSEAFRGFWIGLFEQVKSSFMQAWQTLKPALQNLGQRLSKA